MRVVYSRLPAASRAQVSVPPPGAVRSGGVVAETVVTEIQVRETINPVTGLKQ